VVMNEKLLSLQEFAKRTNYSERQVRDMCLKGKITGARKLPGGRKWLIPESMVGSLKQERESEEPTATVKQDILVLKAREKHLEDLCNSIEMLEQDLCNIYQSGVSITTIPPECLEGYKGETLKALTAPSGEAFLVLFKDGLLSEIWLRTEYSDPVFYCLRSHMDTEVWNLFGRFKDSLKQCLQQLVYESVGSGKHSRSLYSTSVREMISVAQSLITELHKYRYRRVFPGKCEYCP